MNETKPLQPVGQPEQVEELEREIQRLLTENEGLKKKVKDLEEELRASKRQAAPFSKGQRKANPKRPGRKAGQGIFRNRPAPAASIGGEIVDHAKFLASMAPWHAGNSFSGSGWLNWQRDFVTCPKTPPVTPLPGAA